MNIENIKVFGTHDEGTLNQIKACAASDYAVAATLCADGHKGYNMPIGGVVAYRNAISPAGVGFDIACGNKAVRLDLDFTDIQNEIPAFADEIVRSISFGIGRVNEEGADHELFDDPAWKEVPHLRNVGLKQRARNQLGTVGSGNHYVDVFRDEQNRVWVGVHFGSRGLGHNIASHFITAAGGNPNGNMDAPPALIKQGTELFDEYWQAMNLAGRYAYAGRDWVCARVARILGAEIVEEVHNHHNFAWLENHGGEDVYVVRKGATPAFPGQLGFVGGSMGDDSVILEGLGDETGLHSTVHGAGRVMSRTRAAGKIIDRRKGVGKRAGGEVTEKMMSDWVTRNGVELRGGGTDESPHCYKRLNQVLAEHEETVRVVHTLTPVIVCMAGADEFDPYKD